MDWSLFALGPTGWGDELLLGLAVTISIAILSFVIGTIVGVLAGLVELHAPRPVASIFSWYAMVMRSVPELLVIFLIYYAAAFIIQSALALIGLRVQVLLPPFAAGVLALSLVQGAYTSEVFKGAIRAVPTGCREAAKSLGMSRLVAFRTITLPLAFRYAFSGLANLWMVVIKNTPFVSAIGVADLISQAKTAGENTKHYFAFFLAVLLTYLVISGISMFAQLRAERSLFRHLPAKSP